MTSEKPVDIENANVKKTDKQTNKKDSCQTQTLMKLYYELPDEIKPNMLKETPPITIVEIKHNGCELNAGICDSFKNSPEVGDKVYDIDNEGPEVKEIERNSPDDCTEDDLEALKKLLESKPKLLEKYLREYASVEEVNRLQTITSGGPLSPRPRHEARSTSVTSDLFQLWLSSSPVKVS